MFECFDLNPLIFDANLQNSSISSAKLPVLNGMIRHDIDLFWIDYVDTKKNKNKLMRLFICS